MLQCGMKTILPVSKRGSVTLPPALRKKFNLTGNDNALVILEERDGELILSPATAVPIRDIPPEKMALWIEQDEEEMDQFEAEKK